MIDIMEDNLKNIDIDKLIFEVDNMLTEGYRFVTASCVSNNNEECTITYHFNKNMVYKHLRITTTKDDEIPSISGKYFCAILVENEMKELFGLNITNIQIDYGGHMLLAEKAPLSPMSKQQIIIEKRD